MTARTGAPAISVVIPCFNAERTLAATIRSALAQGDVDLEVIVVDDGSRDGSLAIARSFEAAITVLTGANRGVSAARNTGTRASRGEWLVFLDADDLLAPDTLRRRLDAVERAAGSADVVICDWREIDEAGGGEDDGPVRGVDVAALAQDSEAAIVSGQWAPTAALMYRRAMVEAIGGFRDDLPVIQDARFLFDAAHHGARLLHDPHVGACYRIVAASLSRRDPARFWRDVLLNGAQIETLWRARNALADERRALLAHVYNTAARGLLSAADGAYFEAVERQGLMSDRLPLHPRLARPLARVFGLPAARRMVGWFGR